MGKLMWVLKHGIDSNLGNNKDSYISDISPQWIEGDKNMFMVQIWCKFILYIVARLII